MKTLPPNPDIDQLKRQAKDLLRDIRRGDPQALARFRAALPAAAGRDDASITAMALRLHDAQSCIAREHGAATWPELVVMVETAQARGGGADRLAAAFYRFVYGGDMAGGTDHARPESAARLLAEHPELANLDPWIACGAGNVPAVRQQIAADPAWVNRTGGRYDLTPLIATAQSSLLRIAEHRANLLAVADLLLDAGADPNLRLTRHWGPSAEAWEASPLHGAAGVNHDPDLTRRLLVAGADPDDGESLYHSIENPVCTPILLEHGATVAGSNALARCLDEDDIDTFRLLLSHAEDVKEPASGWLLYWGIRRRRSPAHFAAMLAAGADPAFRTQDGTGVHTLALRYGLTEVAQMLAGAGAATDTSEEDLFIAACARVDAEEARLIQARRPDLPRGLDPARLKMLPELAEAGNADAVRLMVDLGWPIDVRGGDWDASALNQAVFRGNASLARYLLERGASWTEEHGFGDNVCGTLSWASYNEPVTGGDYEGCARALIDHGMPMATPDPDAPDRVRIAGASRPFSAEVTGILLGET